MSDRKAAGQRSSCCDASGKVLRDQRATWCRGLFRRRAKISDALAPSAAMLLLFQRLQEATPQGRYRI